MDCTSVFRNVFSDMLQSPFICTSIKLGSGLVAQSCLTLCSPMDCTRKNPGVGCHFLAQ